jgi:hypothetical protein
LLFGKRRYDVQSPTPNRNVVVADGRITCFGGGNELGMIQLTVFNP